LLFGALQKLMRFFAWSKKRQNLVEWGFPPNRSV